MINVNNSTTTLTFTAPSLPDGVFTGAVVVVVTAISRLGIGSPSASVSTLITGIYLLNAKYIYIRTYICMAQTYTYVVILVL